MKLLLATDAWKPQVNGVVTTLTQVVAGIRDKGHEVEVIAVGDYPSLPLPSYPEIKFSIWMKGLKKRIEDFSPDAIHIATEGPIGQLVRRHCLAQGYTFTTSFHTRFPEYIHERIPVPLEWTYPFVRSFHRPAFRTLAPTVTLVNELKQRGFQHMEVWGRGVDAELFTPERKINMEYPGPVMLSVGRIAPEKNLKAFLDLDVAGTKIVVGDGPALHEMQQLYPKVVFPGVKRGKSLAQFFASADVFVFPSLTDTFGLVMLEANACGTPVAAFPVTGPVDVLKEGVTGCMREDLKEAIEAALQMDRSLCREQALKRSWSRIIDQFLKALMPVNSDKKPDMDAAQTG